MAFTRKKASQIVTGLERPLNRDVLKLAALEATAETGAVWTRDVKRWLREIAALRPKPAVGRLKALTFMLGLKMNRLAEWKS